MRADLDLFNEFWLRVEREKQYAAYASDMRKARPFALDDEIDELLGELAFGDKADDISARRHLSAARLPYPTMWIEHGDLGFGRRRHPELGFKFGEPVKTGWLLRQPDPEAASWTAIRISRVINDNSHDLTASIYPVAHLVNPEGGMDYAAWSQPGPPSKDWSQAGSNALRRMHQEPSTPMMGWGGAWDPKVLKGADMGDDEFRLSPLYGTAALMMEPSFIRRVAEENPHDMEGGIISFMQGAAGDHISELRYLVAALALLNEVPVEFVPFRPKGMALVKSRMRPFMSSSVVSITVPASRRRLKEIDDLMSARSEAAKKARHEVRGHFRHVKKLPSKHPERWEQATDRDGLPVWRTWIDHHLRGSAELGWVEQKYAVVPLHSSKKALTEDFVSDR